MQIGEQNKIYKRTRTGAIQVWSQELGSQGRHRTISGKLDGKMVVSQWTQCKTMFTGQTNERTPEEQAIFEITANYKKKLDKDYFDDLDDVDNEEKTRKPMGCLEYKGPKDFYASGAWVQPKLDGFRCTIDKNFITSKNGKKFVTCPHVIVELQDVFREFPDIVLDGELYNHAYRDDFDSLCSFIKKTKPTPEDIQKSAEIIQFHLYDIYGYGGEYGTRLKLIDLIKPLVNDDIIKIVRTEWVSNVHQLDNLYDEFLSEEYEGQIIRDPEADYVFGKSRKMFKRKEFVDEEFIVFNIEEGQGNWSGRAKRCYLKRNDNGDIFKASIKGNFERTTEILKNKDFYIGKPATVRYSGLTPSGVPRFGRIKEWNREDHLDN